MAFVERYGNTVSEDGWRMVDEAECNWITVRGTDVSLEIRKGIPTVILGEFAARFNEQIEPLRDPDSACWTPTNDVPTSNHMAATACFSGDVEILTREGPRSIGELCGTEAELLTADPYAGRKASWVHAPINSFGVQQTQTITLSRHGRTKTVRATADHRWFVRRIKQIFYNENGRKRSAQRERVEEVTTAQLQPGDVLMTSRPRAEAAYCEPSPIGVVAGLVFGDGSVNRTNRPQAGAVINLFGPAQELIRFFPEPRVHHYGDALYVDNLPRRFKTDLPSLDESTGYLLGWLAGMVAADGHVTETGSIVLHTAREDVARFVRDLAPRLGIGAHVSEYKRDEGSYRPGVLRYVISFEKVTLDSQFFVRTDQRARFGEIERSPSRWKVVSVTEGLEEPVFCASVPTTRTFVLDEFILTGNCDLNWNSHAFRVRGTFGDRLSALLGLLDEFRIDGDPGVWWGGWWDDPIDEMHFQLNWPEGDPRNDALAAKLQDAAPPPPLSRMDRYALAWISEGQKRSISRRGICIALTVPFVESGWQMYANSNVPESLNFPHDAVGSDHDSTGLAQQRQAWGPLACTMDPACSAGLFYDGGQAGQRGLTDFDYDNEANTPGHYAQAVQVSAFPDRYDQHWDEANALFDRLATAPPPPPPPPPAPPPAPGDDMAQVPQAQWDALFRAVMDQRQSRSPLRHLGEGVVGDAPDQIWDIDGSVHVLVVKMLAELGSPNDLALLREVAAADPVTHPDRQNDAVLAATILARISEHPAPAQPTPAAPPSLPVASVAVDATSSTGQLIGRAYDALDALQLGADVPDNVKAPLTALIAVLQSYPSAPKAAQK